MDEKRTQTNEAAPAPARRLCTPQRAAWLKKQNRKLMLIRAGIVALGGMIFVVGLMLLILPLFRVRSIEIVGNTVTTREEILAASGVEEGAEIIGTDWQAVVTRIEGKCPVRVKLKLTPGKLQIEVIELEQLYFEYADKWFSLDRDLRVLSVSDSEEAFDGLIEVKLPDVASLAVGETLSFRNGDIDRTYIQTVLEMFDTKELTDRVVLLDAEEKYNVSYVLDGTLRVVLGKVTELDVKLKMAEEILAVKNGCDAYAVVDVSNVKKSTYRPITTPEFLMAG